MAKWHDMTQAEVLGYFQGFGRRIRSQELKLGRQQYALAMAQGVRMAIHCGVPHITAVELGVFEGVGLLELCDVAAFFNAELGMEFTVIGFDNATGLPVLNGYIDHPELWHHNAFRMPDQDKLRAALPPFAKLIIGDLSDTIGVIEQDLKKAPLGFIGFDVDLYSSTKLALRILKFDPECYLPAVPATFDDSHTVLSHSDWCGEAAAVREFNEVNTLRKIDRKPTFNIFKFGVCQIFDHPIRQGSVRARWGLSLGAF
jgi:hypothetical protein